jgi:hypothetical protein
MKEGQTLAQSLHTRLQLGLLGTANTVAHGVRVSRGVADQLKAGGAVRPVNQRVKPPLRLSAVCGRAARREAFGGYLYLAVAIRRDATIHGGQVAYGTEDSVCEIDILPYGDIRQRIGLKEYQLVYRLLNRIIADPTQPDILVVDRTLLLPKQFANSDDAEVQREYRLVADKADGLWKALGERLAPRAPGGLIVVGYPETKRMGEPLTSIANGRSAALIDPVTVEPIRAALARGKPLEEGAAARIMGTVLWPEQRTAAFAYSGLGIDERAEPRTLRHGIDVASFHYRAGLRTPPQQVEVAGGRAWTSEGLDRLAERLIEATMFDQPDAVPLPLWLGRRQFQELAKIDWLKQYQEDVFHTLRSGELDKAWLRGWEPEGG